MCRQSFQKSESERAKARCIEPCAGCSCARATLAATACHDRHWPTRSRSRWQVPARRRTHTAGRGDQEIRVVSYVGYVGGGLKYLVKSMISAGGNFLAH